MLLFYTAEFFAAGHFPRGWAFGFIALPGALFLYGALRDNLRGHRLAPKRPAA